MGSRKNTDSRLHRTGNACYFRYKLPSNIVSDNAIESGTIDNQGIIFKIGQQKIARDSAYRYQVVARDSVVADRSRSAS